MTRRINITAGSVSVLGSLDDNFTADAIWDALPISGRGETWGDELYFSIPVQADEAEDAEEVVPLGTLAYWPPGNAFCIFYGRTPASHGSECRAASPVNPVGMIQGDCKVFKWVTAGADVTVERAD